jgi:RNA polymerase sigma-70 factor (ECF subfamily)
MLNEKKDSVKNLHESTPNGSVKDITWAAYLNPATQFEELYLTEYSKILFSIIKIVGNKEIAEDLAHDTFIKAYNARLKYQSNGHPPYAWLKRIGHNLAVSYLRHQQTVAKYGYLFESEERFEELGYSKIEISDLIERALGTLPPKKLKIVTMFYFGGMTESQISKELKIPISSVGSILTSSRRKMRLRLAVQYTYFG